MRALLLVIGITSACSGSSAAPGGNGGEAGAGGEPTQAQPRERCERTDHVGTFTASYELLSGDCGEPADETATVIDLESVAPCERLADDVWSGDNCTRQQHVSCGSIELLTELTLQTDGSLSGEQTRTIQGQAPCSSSYGVVWVRQ